MKKISMLLSALLIAGITFAAPDGKDKKGCCKKDGATTSCCHKGGTCTKDKNHNGNTSAAPAPTSTTTTTSTSTPKADVKK